MKNTTKTIVHLVFVSLFILIDLFICNLLNSLNEEISFTYIFTVSFGFYLFPSLVSYLISSFILFPRFLSKSETRNFSITFILSGIVGAFLGSLFFSFWFGIDFMFKDNLTSFFSEFLTMFFLAIITSAFGIVVEVFFDWKRKQRERALLMQYNHELQLSSLQGKLEPHFLFNTLNNIESLIHEFPSRASEYIIGLSELLRYISFKNEHKTVELNEEISALEKYIELQRIRSENPNFVRLKVKGSLTGVKVPTMIFIPIVENAFKYVSNNSEDEMINISVSVENSSVCFTCENKFNASKRDEQDSLGTGEKILEERYNLLIGEGKYKYIKSESNGVYTAFLTFEYE